MKRFTLTLLLLLIFIGSSIQAQNKKELIEQVNTLNSELSSIKAELLESQKNEKISQARADSFESQLQGLQENNATLLQNLNNFTTQSNDKLDNLGNVMESLRKKEAELKFINDAFTSNDSISLLVLTNLKQTLGENANIKVEKGAVVVIMDHTTLFGANAGNTKIEGGSTELLNKLAGVIKSNPDMAVTLEFHTDDTKSWENVYAEASSVATALGNTAEIKPERIKVSRKSEMANNLHIRLHPNFNTFYINVRENMKN
jgi:outer membrane protein OmpA-like peptidoglycan-associated protein